jgi:S-DNA-T family DNA segregation ATPase FtsK/SpoIIIE
MAPKNKRKKVKAPKQKRSPKAPKAVQRAAGVLDGKRSEIFGVIFVVAAVVVCLSLASSDPADPVFDGSGPAVNLAGMVGAYLADGLLSLLGFTAFLIVAGLLYAAAVAFTRGAVRVSLRQAIGYLALTVQATALSHIALAGSSLLGHAPGGLLGEYAGGLFVTLFSWTGSVVVLTAGLLMGLIAVTDFSLVQTGRLLGRGLAWLGRACGQAVLILGRGLTRAGLTTAAWFRAQGREFIETLRHNQSVEQPALAVASASGESLSDPGPPSEMQAEHVPPIARLESILQEPVSCPPQLGRREPVVVTSPPPMEAEGPTEMEAPSPSAGLPFEDDGTASTDQNRAPQRATKANRELQQPVEPAREPEIVIPKPPERDPEEPAAVTDEIKGLPSVDWGNYKLPSLDILESEERQSVVQIDKQLLHEYAKRLEQKLADYGVQGQVTKIMPGPVVTMYEYAPGPGIKVARIYGLSQDLALALEAISVRIIAPIPGRAVVGIEVSNKKRQMVYAKEIIGHKSFTRNKSKLTMALGKDIEGTPYVADLNKMPHLLVAGATGTGKSVALNAIITSILYKASPEDVRFIMVDPKVLELSLYEGIPHLLLPVVTNPRKAQAALQWAVNEMEQRIQILHGAGVRNLDSFNTKASAQAKALAEGKPDPTAKTVRHGGRKKKIVVIDKTAASEREERVEIEVEADAEDVAPEEGLPRLEKLPHIVIVIDELADLMMTCGREVETNIARIAQKARAVGIHLIVATQRPSVNVITGLIKANLPARISFRVASKVDSRTILDSNGAESLLGNGDMLFHPPTSSELIRVHGAFISEEEITEVVEHLKAQADPVYNESILAAAEEVDNPESDVEEEPHDEFYDQAVQIVAEMGQASTSMVQRKLRIGYNRAARLIERMEREGIVGPPDGSRPRKVLIQNHEP